MPNVKIQQVAEGASLEMTIPQAFVETLKIKKGDLMEVRLDIATLSLVYKKVENNGQ